MLESKHSNKEYQSPVINRNTNNLVNKKVYSEFCELISDEEHEVSFIFAWNVLVELFNI